MRIAPLAVAIAALAPLACGRPVANQRDAAPGGNSAVEHSSCEPGAVLQGTVYDIARSRFAFGSTPVREDASGLIRWVGDHGVVAIWPSGQAMGSMNGGAPETSLPDWSNDPAMLEAHVRAYFVSLGIDACQAPSAQANGGTGGRTILFSRSVDGIEVSESGAYARFEIEDRTTAERLYWPTIGADVVTAARALRDRLADPVQLAAYKALLPAEAQGDGVVRIHHSSDFQPPPFVAGATYDVVYQVPGVMGRGSTQNFSFDAAGAPVTTTW